MKRFIRCICLILVVSTMLGTVAFAAESRASSFFTKYSVYLYRESSTSRTFQVWFDVLATRTMTELGASTIKIQRSSDGVNWTTMKTFSKDDYSQMICSNTARHATYVTYTGLKDYYYRAYVELYAKDSTGTAYMPAYTSKIQLP